MKIAYLLHYNDSLESGVFKKVLSQVKTWVKLGHETRIYVISRNRNSRTKACVDGISLFSFNYELYDRMKIWQTCVDEIINWSPQIVYFRYDLYYPAFTKLTRRIPVVVEINTDDVKEYKLTSKSVLRKWYNLLTRRLLLSQAKGLVFVTGELQKSNSFARYNKPSIVIGNGIDLSQIPQLPVADDEVPRLVFIGAGTPWHGIDKLLDLARNFPFWKFEVIGMDSKDFPPNVLTDNIICHGFLKKNQYEKILTQATLAVGTLALHRIDMQEASPLKVREYLAYGLPVIIAYDDTDFPNPVPFILQLSNGEDNIAASLNNIRDFGLRTMSKRVQRKDIQHLDVNVKEVHRLKFMGSILDNVRVH